MRWSRAATEQVQTYNIVEERHLTNPDSTQPGTVVTADQQAKVATGRTLPEHRAAGGRRRRRQRRRQSADQGRQPDDEPLPRRRARHHRPGDQHLLRQHQLRLARLRSRCSPAAWRRSTTRSAASSTSSPTPAATSCTSTPRSTSTTPPSPRGNQYGAQLYNGTRPFPSNPAADDAGLPGQPQRRRADRQAPALVQRRRSSTTTPSARSPPGRRSTCSIRRARSTASSAASSSPGRRRYKHRVTLSASTDPAFISNVNQSNTGLGVTENHQNQGGVFAIVQWDYFKSEHVNTNVQLGFQFNHSTSDRRACSAASTSGNDVGPLLDGTTAIYDPMPPAPHQQRRRHRLVSGLRYSDRPPLYGAVRSVDIAARQAASARTTPRSDLQSRFIYHGFHFERPGGSVYNDAGGGAGEAGPVRRGDRHRLLPAQDVPAFDNHQWGLGAGIYVQDRWKPWKRLTILPGIRFDWGLTTNSVGQTVSNLFGVGPRLGATSRHHRRQQDHLQRLLRPLERDAVAARRRQRRRVSDGDHDVAVEPGDQQVRAAHHSRAAPAAIASTSTRRRRTPTRSPSACAARSSRTRSPASTTRTRRSRTSGTASRSIRSGTPPAPTSSATPTAAAADLPLHHARRELSHLPGRRLRLRVAPIAQPRSLRGLYAVVAVRPRRRGARADLGRRGRQLAVLQPAPGGLLRRLSARGRASRRSSCARRTRGTAW